VWDDAWNDQFSTINNIIFQTRLSKILLVKKECIEKLKDMNTQAEKMVNNTDKILIIFIEWESDAFFPLSGSVLF